MKLFEINESIWVIAPTQEDAIAFACLESDEITSIEEIPENRWDEDIEVYTGDLLEDDEPEATTITFRQLMWPAIESGEPMTIMTED